MADRAHDEPPATDDDLAREARAGSLPAFDALARRLQVPLINFLSRRFRSRRDVEDLTQETLLRAYRSLGAYDPRRPVRAWVFTIAYRLAVSSGRGVAPAGSLPQSTPAGPDPATLAEHQDFSRHVWETARAVLTPDQVSALWLFYAEDLPVAEIAMVMNHTVASVKVLLHRARLRLRPHLEPAHLTETTP